MHAARDEPRDVRHVDDHRCADVPGNLRDARKVDHARVRARADHDHLRLVLVREPLELLVVDPLVVFADAVRHDCVELSGEIQRMAVRQVAAVREVHAEHRVARLQQREIDSHVGLRAGVRLDVHVFRAKQLFRTRDCERLRDIDELAAAVVALPGITLRVLVRHHRAGGFEHGGADEVFRRNQLEPFGLAVDFVPDRIRDLDVGFSERALHREQQRGRHRAKLYYGLKAPMSP